MGRMDYREIGRGFTVEEARRDAIESAREYYGHQEGYSGGMNCSTGEDDKVKCLKKPKIGKRCKVEKIVQKGARKWKTTFIISPYWSLNGREPSDHADTQGEAIKRARELSVKHQCDYEITIKKELVQGNSKIAKIVAPKGEMGEWLFTGVARS